MPFWKNSQILAGDFYKNTLKEFDNWIESEIFSLLLVYFISISEVEFILICWVASFYL